MRGRVLVDVYMKNNASPADEARVQRELLAVPHVKAVHFVSKQKAYAQQAKSDPAAYALLGSNPLPDTFHVIPDNGANVLAIRSSLTHNDTGVIDPSIQSVSNKKNDTKKALELTSAVKWGGLVLLGAADHRVDPADRQHDPALALRPPA